MKKKINKSRLSFVNIARHLRNVSVFELWIMFLKFTPFPASLRARNKDKNSKKKKKNCKGRRNFQNLKISEK